MAYRVVYDVLDDRLVPTGGFGPVGLFFALVWLAVWFFVFRYARGRTDRRGQMRAGAVVGGLFVALAVCVLVTEDYPSYADQKQCAEWAGSGDHETVAGRVTGFYRGPSRSPPVSFQVGEVRFSYRFEQRHRGGFQGRFTAAAAADLQLRNGLPVRIAHRDGRILRIEVGVE